MPVDIGSYEKLCTECVLPADIMAVFVGLRAQQHGETTWVSAVSLDDSLLDFDNVSVVTGGSQINKTTLLNAQRQDPAIGKVLKFKESGRWLSCCTGIVEQMHSCCCPSVFIVLSLKNYTRKWDI